MRVFKDMDMVEQLRSGIPQILEHYGKEAFHFIENFLKMVFPMASPLNKKEIKRPEPSDGLVETQRRIIKFIRTRLVISTTAIDKNITALKAKNILKRVGSPRSGHWKITKQKK